MWHTLICIEPSVLAGVLESLDELDTARLLVYALENDDRATVDLVRDCSPLSPFEDQQLLHVAAAHGCLRAVYQLSRRKRPQHKTPFGYSTANEELRLNTGMLLKTRRQHVMALVSSHQGQYLFPGSVMYEAVRHGDLDVVRWLQNTSEYNPIIAVEHAAGAGQLAVAQWLAEHAHDILSNARNAQMKPSADTYYVG